MKLRFQIRFFLLLSIFLAISISQVFSQSDLSMLSVTDGASLAPTVITIEKRVWEVSVVLSVTDQKGRFVENLQPTDFSILDNDKRQDMLTFFQSETDLPLHVALLLDISSSVADKFSLEQETISEFLRAVAHPGDKVDVFAFNQDVQLVAPITNNWKQVSRRIRKLKAGGETALYDAISTAALWLEQAPEPSRRMIIVITDGVDNVSKTSVDDAISQALAVEASIYTVNVGGEFSVDLMKEGAANLKKLADATGGNYLRAETDGTVHRPFGKIERELRSQYALTYKPSNPTEQAFHRLQVIAPSNLRVRCRTGYYAK